MKTFSIKTALSALAVAALLTSPALAAKKVHQARQSDNAVVYSAAPGNDIPAYNSEGAVVGIANPDQYGEQSQR